MALIQYLTRIQFDAGAVRETGPELERLGCRRPLIVTDAGLVDSAVLAAVRAAMPDGDMLPMFAETPANPTEGAVLAALGIYRAQSCDGLVAVGGGSPIDLAKAVRLLSTHGDPLAEYVATAGGIGRIRPDQPPLVAIPTTAGTGSEVGRGSLIILADGRKLALISPYLIPNVAIVDPDLTLGLPPDLTAGTGMDAVSHCIETYLSAAINPPADAIALDGLARASGHIVRATENGADRTARWHMSMAAMMGAMTFQKGLGAVHALSHPLGALGEPNLHHGTLNAVLLPEVVRVNGRHVPEKVATLGRVMGRESDLPGALRALTARLGLPTSLRHMGVPRQVLNPVAEAATRDFAATTNPVALGAPEYFDILERSY